jgi:para-nitrobenzyl esterase
MSAEHDGPASRPHQIPAGYDEVVATAAGRVGGQRVGAVAAFAGLPYATAARFAAPVPVAGWDGVRDATRPGPAAPQPPSRLAAVMGPAPDGTAEDGCLTLNVWTPDPAGSFPVLFWLHGGAWSSGSGGWPWYDGARLAAEQQIVVVTANYRLGPLGYLVLAEADETLGHGNFGFADQVAALAWVAEQISSFGGDPARITVGGQSAGAHSAALLAAAEPTRALVRRVLLQSGPFGSPLPTETAAARVAAAVVSELGLPPAATGLRELPPGDLLAAMGRLAQRSRALGNVYPPLQPVRGAALPWSDPLTALADAPAELDVLVGATTEESRAFFDLDPAVGAADQAAVLAALEPMVADATDVYARYQQDQPGRSPGQLLASIVTDKDFRAPVIGAARARQRQAGLGQPGSGSAFVYEFDWRSGPFGACHCIDLPFLLGERAAWTGSPMLAGIGPEFEPLRRSFTGAVGAFVRDGSPGWAPFGPAQPAVGRFGPEAGCSVEARPDLVALAAALTGPSAGPGR